MLNFLKRSFRKTLHLFHRDLIPYDIHSSKHQVDQTILKHFSIKTAVEGGANKRQYGAGPIENGFAGEIYLTLNNSLSELKKSLLRFSVVRNTFY